MFPTFFNEDKTFNSVKIQENSLTSEPILGNLVNSNNFTSREIYNNLGLSYLLNAIENLESEISKYF